MNDGYAWISCKVVSVKREQMGHSMNVHGRNQTSVVDLDAHHGMGHHKTAPLAVYLLVIRKQSERAFDQLSAPIRLPYRQSKAILTGRPSADIPKLGQVLGREAQPRSL
jgi:hypothetical protein